jgi:hypothetical protein
MSKIVYELPISPLIEGFKAYVDGGGVIRQFLADHDQFKKEDLVYWFDPEEKVSDFGFIEEFKLNGFSEDGAPDIAFVIRLRGGESEELKKVTATIDDIIRIVGVISPACNWLEEGEEIDDSHCIATFAVPVGQPTLPVEGDDTVVTIPAWRIVGVDPVILHNVVEIYNEHCFHYH